MKHGLKAPAQETARRNGERTFFVGGVEYYTRSGRIVAAARAGCAAFVKTGAGKASWSRARARRLGYAPCLDPLPPMPVDGRCQCCGEQRALCLDHCHIIGDFRGWICNACNRGIDALGDDLEGARRAVAYLTRAAKRKLTSPHDRA